MARLVKNELIQIQLKGLPQRATEGSCECIWSVFKWKNLLSYGYRGDLGIEMETVQMSQLL